MHVNQSKDTGTELSAPTRNCYGLTIFIFVIILEWYRAISSICDSFFSMAGNTFGDTQEPIAIVGAACRLPGGVSSLPELWDLIRHARTARQKVPKDRFDADAWYHPDPDRKGTVSCSVSHSVMI
jgi:hypothetical protein